MLEGGEPAVSHVFCSSSEKESKKQEFPATVPTLKVDVVFQIRC